MFGFLKTRKIYKLPIDQQISAVLAILREAEDKGKSKIKLNLYPCNRHYWSLENALTTTYGYTRINKGMPDLWIITPLSKQKRQEQREANKDLW